MSNEVSGLVWRHYAHAGARLLAMLALADYADDDGAGVFPSAARLGRKIRVETRSARRLLSAMRRDGDIVPIGRTSGGVTIYRVDLVRLRAGIGADTPGTPPDIRSGGDSDDMAPLTPQSGPPDPGVSHSPPVIPSVNPPPPRGGGGKKKPAGQGGDAPTKIKPQSRAREKCEIEINRCPHEQRESVMKELSARMSRTDLPCISSPAAYLAALIDDAIAGNFEPRFSGQPGRTALTDVERAKIEVDYQRRAHESRERGGIALGLRPAATPRV